MVSVGYHVTKETLAFDKKTDSTIIVMLNKPFFIIMQSLKFCQTFLHIYLHQLSSKIRLENFANKISYENTCYTNDKKKNSDDVEGKLHFLDRNWNYC